MNRAIRAALIFVLTMAGLSAPPRGTETADELTAREILTEMASAYATCSSYRDTGEANTTVIMDDGRRRVVRKTFETAFVRDVAFRFEYREGFKRYIVSRVGDTVRTWWTVVGGTREPANLDRALAAAMGVSDRVSHTLPRLLLPDEVTGNRLSDLGDAERLPDAELGGTRCFRIQGVFVKWPQTIWIDAETFMVLRIDSRSTFDDFRTERTTTYAPQLDVEITEDELAFDPPAER